MVAKLTLPELTAFLNEAFPQTKDTFTITAVTERSATVELAITAHDLRPGGTVSGPTMFTLADTAFYMAVLGALGLKALAVTTNCSINFMRKPKPTTLIAQARILKLGKTLAMGDVMITCEGMEGAVAHAAMTYAIPPSQGQTLVPKAQHVTFCA
ncbi:MAG: PaaI family thioesterase [Myxococcota bacterium]